MSHLNLVKDLEMHLIEIKSCIGLTSHSLSFWNGIRAKRLRGFRFSHTYFRKEYACWSQKINGIHGRGNVEINI